MAAEFDAIVIGGSDNGLVSAAYLSQSGLRVAVVEQGEHLGGAGGTFEFHPGFHAGVCGTGPAGLDGVVLRELRRVIPDVQIKYPDPALFALTESGAPLPLYRDPAPAAEAIARHSAADASRWPAFCGRVHRMAEFLAAVYRRPAPTLPVRTTQDALSLLPVGLRWLGLGRKERVELLRVLPMSIEEFLEEWFESDVVKGAVASQAVHGTSLGPMASGTTFRYLHRLVGMSAGMTVPSSYVVGGAQSLWKQLADFVLQRGGVVWTSKQVRKVIVRGGRAEGVVLASGEELHARAVLSAADAGRTFLDLVDAGELDPDFLRAVGSIKYRGAQARVLFALDSLGGLQAGDAAHTGQGGLLFAPSIEYLERAADDAKYGRVSARPWFQATIASLADPDLAPHGKHVLEVTVQYAPYHLADSDWDAPTREALGDQVQSMLTESRGMEAPLARHVVTPPELEDRFGFPEGNPDQGEMTLDQILFLRPVAGWANSLTPIPGLYLCGAAAHPGGGVNGRPGRLAARRVLTDLRRQRSRR